MDISQVLDLARNWQNTATKTRGTVMLQTRDCVTQFSGRVSVQDDVLTIISEGGCETCLALRPDMTFAYVDEMLRINGGGWYCTLYEEKVKSLVRLI